MRHGPHIDTSMLRHFRWAFAATVIGLVLGAWVGWEMTGTLGGTASIFFVCCVLAVLEISLSFDNAVVNANKLKNMTPKWQRRFLTWGILIAVFGMRVLFPLLIVVIAAQIGPWQAVLLAATEPDRYSAIMHDAHLPIAAFGGTFLMMVGLNFFFDHEKDIHWVYALEDWAKRYSSIRGIEIALVLTVMLFVSRFLPNGEMMVFIRSAVWGLLTFLLVEVLAGILDMKEKALSGAAKGGLGAFALTQNLFVIAIGLGIGAMYVRSMTIMLVEKETLSQYRYLEHGAFYAILILSVIMYTQTLYHIPEVITGLAGAGLIGVSLISSIRWNRANQERYGEARA